MTSPDAIHSIQFQGTGVFNPDTLAAMHRESDADCFLGKRARLWSWSHDRLVLRLRGDAQRPGFFLST